MPSSAGIVVEGAARLRRTMRQAGEDLQDLRDAHGAAAGIAGGRARATAPRRLGRLATTVRWGASKTGATIRAGGARAPYGGPIHWGWPRRHIAAQPWISEAATDTEPQWTAVYAAAVQRIVNRIQGA